MKKTETMMLIEGKQSAGRPNQRTDHPTEKAHVPRLRTTSMTWTLRMYCKAREKEKARVERKGLGLVDD